MHEVVKAEGGRGPAVALETSVKPVFGAAVYVSLLDHRGAWHCKLKRLEKTYPLGPAPGVISVVAPLAFGLVPPGQGAD
jgi:hypothetical protein